MAGPCGGASSSQILKASPDSVQVRCDGAPATEGSGGRDSVPIATGGSASRQTGRPLEPPPTERQRRRVAEREGFEPSVEFPLHTLSKRAPSTTRTSLHFRINGLRGVRNSLSQTLLQILLFRNLLGVQPRRPSGTRRRRRESAAGRHRRGRQRTRLSYAQCSTAWRCRRRQSTSPLSQCFRMAATCREMARHRRICLASSRVLRPR